MSSKFDILCDQFRVALQKNKDIPHPSSSPAELEDASSSRRISKEELVRNMDRHNPHGCSHYGGSLPLMTYAQTPAVLVRSSNQWQCYHYALPKTLPMTNELLSGEASRGSMHFKYDDKC